MKGWVRLSIVLSGFWMAGVLFFVVAEFITRHPEACVKAETFLDAKEFFFSCNKFANLVPNFWNRFLLELNAKRFLLVWLGPVVLLGNSVTKSNESASIQFMACATMTNRTANTKILLSLGVGCLPNYYFLFRHRLFYFSSAIPPLAASMFF